MTLAAMRWLLIPLLLLAVPLPLVAQPARPNPAEARRAELDRAHEALRSAPDAAGAAVVEARIRQLWAQSASPAILLLLHRAARNMQASLATDALEDCDAAITLAPELPDAWLARAEAYQRTGDSAAAARDLQEALRLDPRRWDALLALSALQDAEGDAAAALRSLDAALAIHPHLPGAASRQRALRRKALGDEL